MKIILKKYNKNWKEEYEKEKSNLLQKIGHIIDQIEHIGSTAISGMLAKPTIDICIGVSSLDRIDEKIIRILNSLGYKYLVYLEKGIPDRRYFQKLDDKNHHLFHIHIVLLGGKLWNNHINFRDHLSSNPSDAKEYMILKKELKKKFFNDRDSYTNGKAFFINNILLKLGSEKPV